MRLRGFWGTWAVLTAKLAIVIIVGEAVVFLLIGIAGTLAGEGSFGEWLAIMAAGVGAGVVVGVGFGLLLGFLNAFNYKSSTISVSFQDGDEFFRRLEAAIKELGFRPEAKSQKTFIYKRTAFREKLMKPRISVQMEQTSATIVGPAGYIGKLRKKITLSEIA
jgi:hypothetical protein